MPSLVTAQLLVNGGLGDHDTDWTGFLNGEHMRTGDVRPCRRNVVTVSMLVLHWRRHASFEI